MTQNVFQEDGWGVAKPGLARIVFEKKASSFNNMAYGNWLSDSSVWVRVKVTIAPVAGQTCAVECQAYMVRDRGSATEEEIKLSSVRRKPYQKLLEKVAARLGGRSGTL